MSGNNSKKLEEGIISRIAEKIRSKSEIFLKRREPLSEDFGALDHEARELKVRWAIEPEKPSSFGKNPIRYLKWIYARVLFLFLRPFLSRQLEFNAAVMRSLTYLIDGHKELISNVNILKQALVEMADDISQGFSTTGDMVLPEIESLKRDWEKFVLELEELRKDLSNTLLPTVEDLAKDQNKIASELDDLQKKFRKILFDINEGLLKPSLAKSAQEPYSYRKFEDCFRGSEREQIEKYSGYIDYFKDSKSVLDVGCGRGELLEVLRRYGIEAMGIDTDPEMVDICLRKKLNVRQADVFDFLKYSKDGGIDSVYLGMLIEHLAPGEIYELLKLLSQKMSEGETLVIETINPQSFAAMSSSFILDLTHKTLLHPLTLEFLLREFGFSNIRTVFTSPVEKQFRLQLLKEEDLRKLRSKEGMSEEIGKILETWNKNFGALDNMIFGFQDYLTIARK